MYKSIAVACFEFIGKSYQHDIVNHVQLDTGQVFSFKPAQCSLFWGMSKGQESRFLAIFEKLYSSSGPQKP